MTGQPSRRSSRRQKIKPLNYAEAATAPALKGMTSFLDVKPEEIRDGRFRDFSLSGRGLSGVTEIPADLSSSGDKTPHLALVASSSQEHLPAGQLLPGDETPPGYETSPLVHPLADMELTLKGVSNKTVYAKEAPIEDEASPVDALSPQHERPTRYQSYLGGETSPGDETTPGDVSSLSAQTVGTVLKHSFLPSRASEGEVSLGGDTSFETAPSATRAILLQPPDLSTSNEKPASEKSPRRETSIGNLSSLGCDTSPGDETYPGDEMPLGHETQPREFSSNLIPGRGRSKVKRCILAQDGHSLGEEAVYQILWRTGKQETADPNSSRTNRIGAAEIGAKVNMAKKNVRQNISRLFEKLAIEILEDFETMHSQARLYRVFSYKQILERRRAAGMEYVLRNKGVIFCTRDGKEIILPPGDETPAGDETSLRPAPSKRRKKSNATHRASSLANDKTDQVEKILVNSENPDLQIVIKALNKYWNIDQAAAVQLLRDCRRIRPDARAEEIAFFVDQKLQLARNNQNILNPTGLILSTVPQSFVGDSFEEFRRRMKRRATLAAEEEERKRQDREDMNRWLRQDRDKYQAIVNDLSKSQKERDEAEKRLREYADLDL